MKLIGRIANRWKHRPTRYRYHLGKQGEISLNYLIGTCYDRRTELVESARSVGADSTQRSDADSVCVWGQYLEAGVSSDPQHGIYGTCASLQVLSMRRPENSTKLIIRALPTVPGLEMAGQESYRAKEIRRGYQEKGDTRTTYKAAAILDVALGLSECERAVVPPRPSKVGHPLEGLDSVGCMDSLISMCLPGGGWPDFRVESGHPLLLPNPHATSVALLSLSRGSRAEFSSVAAGPEETWRLIEKTCNYLLDSATLPKQSISTLSMTLTALENLAGVMPEEMTSTGTDFATVRAACRSEIRKWIRHTSSRECLRSLEALDYQSLEDEAKESRGKRYQFLYYLPHLLAAMAVLSSKSMRSTPSNRQFMKHVVKNFIEAANETGGQVVPGGRQRVSTVETLWAARLINSYSAYFQVSRSTRSRRVLAAFLEIFDTFMNPKVLMVVVGLSVAAISATVVWKFTTPSDQSAQFWLSLFGSIAVSFMSSVGLGWIVSQKHEI